MFKNIPVALVLVAILMAAIPAFSAVKTGGPPEGVSLEIIPIVNGSEFSIKGGGFSVQKGDRVSFRLCFTNRDGQEVASPIPSFSWEINVRSTDGVFRGSRGGGKGPVNVYIPRNAGKIFVTASVWARVPDTGRYGLDLYTNSIELVVR